MFSQQFVLLEFMCTFVCQPLTVHFTKLPANQMESTVSSLSLLIALLKMTEEEADQ